MATHDYVIDNSTGANVRADINNALAAIVSNNSSSSQPATRYAYMWWADTTNGVLKIRNSANDAWIELLQLDGTITLENGAVGTPALAFRDDLDTGIFRSADNKLAISCSGTEIIEFGISETVFNDTGADINFRIEGDTEANLFFVDAGNNRIGIGTSSPDNLLHLFESSTTQTADASSQLVIEKNSNSGITILSGNVHNGRILFGDSGDNDIGQIDYDHNNNSLSFTVNSGESMRIDNGGRLLKGATSVRTINSHVPQIQMQGSSYSNATMSLINNTDDSNGAYLFFHKQRSGSAGGATQVANGNIIGELRFGGGDGVDLENVGALMQVLAAATFTENNTPSDIVFLTAQTTGTTEHMRILNNGDVRIGTSSVSGFGEKIRMRTGIDKVLLNIDSASTGTAAAVVLRHARGGLSGFNGKAFSFVGNDNTEEGSIVIHTTSTAYNTSSDYRLKENEVAISDGITRLKQLKPYQFNFKKDPSVKVDGFFAHEVSSIVPFAVTGEKDAVKKDGSIDPQGIDQSKLVPLLVAAVKELITKVETLEAA